MSARDLTGRWDGIYNYPGAMPPNGFAATLVEVGGAVSGRIAELSDDDRHPGAAVTATVAGERIGSAVRFTKRYGDDHAVRYTGTLAPEGDEVVGEWSIPGAWSGSFIMVRQPGRAMTREDQVGEEVG